MENPENEESPEPRTPDFPDDTARTPTSAGNIAEGTNRVNDDGDNSYFNLPDELRKLPQWVAWKLVPHPDGKKPRKVPINPANGIEAAVNRPQSWGTFTDAVQAVARFGLSGVGFVFTANDPYAGIDLDGGCRDPTNSELTAWAGELVKWLDSYTEASVSGTGLHILVKAQLRSGGGKNGALEVYDRGRFFVMTGEHLGGTPPTIEERQGVIDTLYAENFPNKLNGKATQDKPKKASAKQAATLQEVESALKVLPAVEHEDWLRVGMGLHSVDSGEAGFALWVQWSETCPEKFDLADCHTRWRSFTPEGGVTAATIFGLARDHGWKNTAAREPPAPDWNEDETPEEHEADGTQGEDGEPSSPARRDFHLTDLGNGERFVAKHGTDFLYCPPWKKWLGWDGTHWLVDDMQTVRKRGRDTIRGMYTAAATLVDRMKDASDPTVKAQLFKQQTQLLKHAMQSENAKRVGAMLDLAQMDLTILPKQFDTDLWALNVANGTIDLRTGTMRSHTRTDLITKCVPIVYDPDATCPQWEQFLSEIMGGNDGGNGDLVDFLWKAIGYSLTGDVREDCLFLLYGLGRNGKTTFIETTSAVLGDYATTAAFSTFLHQERDSVRNDIADLQGARFVSATEADQGKRLSEALIKRLTGKDTMKARFLFQEYFQFKPQLKLWLATNYKPVIQGTDDGIWQRVRLIPFTQKFEGRTDDKHLGDKLKQERPGILAWAVRGCLAWQAEGLPLPNTIKNATGEYRKEMDVLGNFLDECCEQKPKLRVKAGDLYNAYVTWSGDKFINQTAFGRALKERGIGREKIGPHVWRLGVALSTGEDGTRQ